MSMGRSVEEILHEPQIGEPVYRVAEFLPAQGAWTEEQFLMLNDDEGLIELVNGRLEFPPVPTESHQIIIERLFDLIRDFAGSRGLGTTRFAGIRVRLSRGNIREPDVAFMLKEHDSRRSNRCWEGADLVVEVVSDDRPQRDWVDKVTDYALAGIPEYWIADPRDNSLTIFTLDAGATEYREAGRYKEGETAASVLLDGLSVNVSAVFAAE